MAGAAGTAARVTLGQRLKGGMADRVVVATSDIARGEHALIRVAPLEPRWWDEGPLRCRGSLPPAHLALLRLATGDWPGLRSLASTAFWEACRGQSDGDVGAGEAGWALLDGPTLLAVCLIVPPVAPVPPAPDPASDPHPSVLVRQAISEAARDARVAWSAHRHGRLTEVFMVRTSLDLPDAILRRQRPTDAPQA